MTVCHAHADGRLSSPAALPIDAIAPHAVAGRPDLKLAVLGATDAALYTRILAAQQAADWHAADLLIDRLGDRLLLGAVLADRYLAPGYPTSLDEARTWLATYPDLPQTPRMRVAGRLHLEPEIGAAPSAADHGLTDPGPGILRRPALLSDGLALLRGGRAAEAARRFETVAMTHGMPPWYVAAAAYWAGRAHARQGEILKAGHWYRLASAERHTFYGMLGGAALGLEPPPGESEMTLTAADLVRLERVPGGRRALAFLQLGYVDRAEAELDLLARHAGAGLAEAIVALADLTGMKSVGRLPVPPEAEDRRAELALYPIPEFRPRAGFSIDRALMFAFMLEESGLHAHAASLSGAAGLMQLMPATARDVARSAGIPLHSMADLSDPETNLSLGQEYVKQLIVNDQVNGNLVLLLAAYNTGPGPLRKYLALGSVADPLMFIEQLPRFDTRLYVQRVLTNLWSYRQRLGQPSPDLAALADGRWPTYESQEDAASKTVASNARRP